MAEYHVENFGCRASQADGASISGGLRQLGLAAAKDFRSADVLVLNTCSVTAEAEKDSRAFIRKARKANPKVRVVVTGCYAQRAPEEVAAIEGVDGVIGNSHKALVAEVAAGFVERPGSMGGALPSPASGFVPVEDLLRSSPPKSAVLASSRPLMVDNHFAHAELAFLVPGAGEAGQLTRPNLKVQDGCGNRCSFCVIPQTRGGSRSVRLETILEGVRAFATGGGKELVLSGINLGRWGRDLPATDRFEHLVECILTQTKLPRMRISSVEPMDWSPALLDLFRSFSDQAHPRLARHAHLPLQSGSDAILRMMYRRYRPWHYAAKVQQIRDALPDAAIGADVMVGFPGETDALFEETFNFIEEQPFTYLHLFPFSARPGTAAWEMHQRSPVAGKAVKERMARLRGLIDRKHRSFCERFVGRDLSVLTLQTSAAGDKAGVTRGLSDNFLSVDIAGRLSANIMTLVRVTGLSGSGLQAVPRGAATTRLPL